MDSGDGGKVVPRQMRKIGPTSRSVSGYVAFRSARSIAYESTLERDFVIRTAFSLHVRDIIPQPVRIPFVRPSGRPYPYTPDYLVLYHSGELTPKPLLVEVKPREEWLQNWRDWLPKWKAAWRYAHDRGWAFHIHDETRIRDRVLENIRSLERYKRANFDADDLEMLLEHVQRLGRTTCRTLLDRCAPELGISNVWAFVWHLLATRRLDCDIEQPLDDSMEVWVPNVD